MKQQNGFSAVIALVIIAALSVIVASGYFVYKESKKDTDNTASKVSQTTTNSNKEVTTATANTAQTEAKRNYTIRYINPSNHEATVILYNETDLAKLPSDFPKGAVDFMRKNIGQPMLPSDPSSCKQVYSVKYYNDVNVEGGDFSVDSAKEACPGGALAVFSINTNDSWVVNGFQAVPQCSLLKEARIYKEFIDQCYNTQNSDGSSNQNDIVANPNGDSTALQ